MAELVVLDEGCGCRFCVDCGPRIGRKIRARLLEHAGRFEDAGMLTLTIDRNGTLPGCGGFTGPEDAYHYVHDKRRVSRLMHVLGVRDYVGVLEFQEDGWPHWHVVFSGRIEFKLLHYWWTHVWGCGLPHVRPGRFGGGLHALYYISKYLTKAPRQGYPEWVYRAGYRIRLITASRSVGALVGKVGRTREEPDVQHGDETAGPVELVDEVEVTGSGDAPGAAITYAERVSQCGRRAVVLRKRKDLKTGEVHFDWVGVLPCSRWELQTGVGDMLDAWREAIGCGAEGDPQVEVEVLDNGEWRLAMTLPFRSAEIVRDACHRMCERFPGRRGEFQHLEW